MRFTAVFLACLSIVSPLALAAPTEVVTYALTAPDAVLLGDYFEVLEVNNVTAARGFGDMLKDLLGSVTGQDSKSGKGGSGGLDIAKLLGTKECTECTESCRVGANNFKQTCGKWAPEHGNEGEEGMFSKSCRPCMQNCHVCPALRELPCIDYSIPSEPAQGW